MILALPWTKCSRGRSCAKGLGGWMLLKGVGSPFVGRTGHQGNFKGSRGVGGVLLKRASKKLGMGHS